MTEKDVLEILNDPKTFVLDVRTPREFQSGSLPRANLIPIDQLQRRTGELPEDKGVTILVYCAHGVRSLHATQFLKGLGYKNVINLDGGLAGFQHRKK